MRWLESKFYRESVEIPKFIRQGRPSNLAIDYVRMYVKLEI